MDATHTASIAAWQPLNSDGYWTWTFDPGLVQSGPELWRRYSVTEIPTGSGTRYIRHRESYTLKNNWSYGLSLLSPITPSVSFQIDWKALALDFTHTVTDYEDYGDSNVSYNYSSRASDLNYQAYALGGKLRFHFSGSAWNLPWGAGGSPWGKVGDPVIELGGLSWFDNARSLGSQWKQFDLATGVVLPLASWVALDADMSWSGDFYGAKNDYSSLVVVPGMPMPRGYEWGLGLRISPNFRLWRADYLRNSNPKGRLGLPALSYHFSMLQAGEGPLSRTQRLALDFPVRPWLTLFGNWTRLSPSQELANLQAPYVNNLLADLDSYKFGTRLHFGSGRNLPKPSAEEKAALKIERQQKKAEARATKKWPRNPDGPASLEIRLDYASVPDLSSIRGSNDRSDSYAVSHSEYERRESLDLSLLLNLRLTMPLSTWFSLGVLVEGAQNRGKVWGSESSFAIYAPPFQSLNYSRASSYESAYSTIGLVALGMFARFHSSGKEWNQPWGEGGSPWGRVLCPSFEVENSISLDSNYNSMKMEMALCSWLALNLGHTFRQGSRSFGRNRYYGGYSNPQEFDLGFRAALPSKSWRGPADYSSDASADGRPGIPVLRYRYRKTTDSDTPYKDTHLVGMDLPLKPGMTISGSWEHIFGEDIPPDGRGNRADFSDIDFFSVGLRFSLSGAGPKIDAKTKNLVEDAGQKPQNLVP